MAITRPVSKTVVSTSIWGFPITDEVNRLSPLVDANVSMLALVTKPTWVSLTLLSGWTAWGSGYTMPAYAVADKMVFLRGSIKNSTGAAVTTAVSFASIPASIVPPTNTLFRILTNSNGSTGQPATLKGTVLSSAELRIDCSTNNTLPSNNLMSLDGIVYWVN